jgi:hypothetical protein
MESEKSISHLIAERDMVVNRGAHMSVIDHMPRIGPISIVILLKKPQIVRNVSTLREVVPE